MENIEKLANFLATLEDVRIIRVNPETFQLMQGMKKVKTVDGISKYKETTIKCQEDLSFDMLVTFGPSGTTVILNLKYL